MSTPENVVLGDNRKLLSIGNAWINNRDDASDTTKPRLTIKIDRDLGLGITLAPNAEMLLFTNKKRDGINPATNAPFQDADYRVAVSLPSEIVDKEVARQKELTEQRRATAAQSVDAVTPEELNAAGA